MTLTDGYAPADTEPTDGESQCLPVVNGWRLQGAGERGVSLDVDIDDGDIRRALVAFTESVQPIIDLLPFVVKQIRVSLRY
jgi:hypothetical protein